jgi:DNA-binding HxlR family transcriptional regulator
MTEFSVRTEEPPLLLCGNEEPIAFRELLTKVGDKWSIFIMLAISMLPKDRARFSEINRSIPTISEKMLASTLRNLERDGLVKRYIFAEVPPRVEYELTAMGQSLLPALQGLVDWVADNSKRVKEARTVFDAK